MQVDNTISAEKPWINREKCELLQTALTFVVPPPYFAVSKFGRNTVGLSLGEKHNSLVA